MNIYFFENDNNLMFHMDKPSGTDPKAEPFLFEGLATDRHIKEYSGQYERFLDARSEAKIKVVNARILSIKKVEQEMKEASKSILES